MLNRVQTVSDGVLNTHAADLDQALAVVGFGWCNLKYCLVLALFLIAALVEPVGYGYVLPAAKCDLGMDAATRGFIASVPYIGIIASSFLWGYLVDTQGRRKSLILSSLIAGTLGILSAFMPETISFAVFKFLSAICISCPAAAPYTFIGEILPQRHRDIMMSITNAMQLMGGGLVALFAWGILPLEFRIDFGAYYFRSWRLLVIVYASGFLISAFLMYFVPESPKFLVSEGKHDEALKVLQMMYAGNKRKSPDDFPIKRLLMPEIEKEKTSFLMSLKMQSVPLLRPPYLKWMVLNSFLLMGLFATLNGLVMWVPDVLNQVFSGGSRGLTACNVISQRNETEAGVCIDTIDKNTYQINAIGNTACAFLALVASVTVKVIGKKSLLILVYCVIGTFTILVNFVTKDLVYAMLLSSFPLMAIGIGPINAFSVSIFPTHLRGMAVGLTMMMGRMGSVIGTNVAGVLINTVCEVTFYFFGGYMFLCGFLSFLLPRTPKMPQPAKLKITKL